ncbi:MAG: HEAT repeat domain-containing protein [Planctomycetes bacterium]|nr:HEAT repeat domain-containing protein [Planctomycetota bacterium]
MSRTRSSLLTLLIALLAVPAFAQEPGADLDELWRVGSLWQVGDNREPVDEARKAIIAAGDDGLKYALTKLDIADTLQIRCLNAVFAGFGDSAFDDLVANIGHESANARRNVADLLARLDDRKAAEPLLAQAGLEENRGARLAQLAALSKWQVEAAVPLLIEISGDTADRIRHRATSLLGAYSSQDSVTRLIAMLDDSVYYVRDGAQGALAGGTPQARALCLASLNNQLGLPGAQQNLQRLRLLLSVIATLADDGTPVALRKALGHESGAVRGEASAALVAWKLGAGLLHELDVDALLKSAIDKEHDPFAKAAMDKARTKLGEADAK